ncbi:MAG: hypothetical protein JW772_02325, partial [Candidatus Diapherotrites archaeon]|nr:hypothetical protein [Candidatus Diapherotrites archaeon]
MQELIEKFKIFCENLEKTDKIAIVHHSDADGIAAGAIAAKAVFKLSGKKPVFMRSYSYGDKLNEEKIINSLISKGVNKLLIVDLGIDSPEKRFEKVKFLDYCVVIDHHQYKEDFNSKKVLFLNAKFFSEINPSRYAAAKLCYDLFGRLVDISEMDWVACVGIFGDKGEDAWEGFVKETIEKNRATEAKIRKVQNLVSAVSVVTPEKIESIVWELFKADIDACCKEEFQKIFDEFEGEKKKMIEQAKENEKNFKEINLCIYTIKPKYPAIKSDVINELSRRNPNKTIILTELTNQRARFSARRGDFKVPVNKVLQKAIEGIPNSTAGGHIPAAAG